MQMAKVNNRVLQLWNLCTARREEGKETDSMYINGEKEMKTMQKFYANTIESERRIEHHCIQRRSKSSWFTEIASSYEYALF